MYQDGFARFCSTKYSTDLPQSGICLCTSHQRRRSKAQRRLPQTHGGKWGISQLKLYLEATAGFQRARKIFKDITDLVVHSLKAVQNVMINDRHCFECYGYDIILDDQLKPWLIEVNASPALSATTEKDALLKRGLIDDLLDVLMQRKRTSNVRESSTCFTMRRQSSLLKR